jgi:hypothetical protein
LLRDPFEPCQKFKKNQGGSAPLNPQIKGKSIKNKGLELPGQAKPPAVVPGSRRVPVAERRTHPMRAAAPGAAPEHTRVTIISTIFAITLLLRTTVVFIID